MTREAPTFVELGMLFEAGATSEDSIALDFRAMAVAFA
jgi:hypothetical protein